jgi:hypothetical protein
MLVLMLPAFGSTGITNCGTQAAEIRNKAGIAVNERGAIPANVRAIDAKPRAFCHFA